MLILYNTRSICILLFNGPNFGGQLITWTAPKFEMIDPLKDAQADTLMIRNGTLLLEDAIASHGYDPKKQLQKIADSNQRLDDLKIILDSDPRQTAKSGQVQVVPNSDNNTDTKQ